MSFKNEPFELVNLYELWKNQQEIKLHVRDYAQRRQPTEACFA